MAAGVISGGTVLGMMNGLGPLDSSIPVHSVATGVGWNGGQGPEDKEPRSWTFPWRLVSPGTMAGLGLEGALGEEEDMGEGTMEGEKDRRNNGGRKGQKGGEKKEKSS